jgi:CIC family chloride channel protein
MIGQALRILVLRHARLSDWQRMLLLAAVVGVSGAFATMGFRSLILAVEQLIYGRSDGLVQIASHLVWWKRLLAPAFGGLLAGWLLLGARKVPGGDKKGGDYMEAIVLGDGKLGVRLSCLRALSSFVSVVSGGAIGREGPMVQLAALTGSIAGRWRDLPEPRRRLLVACGAASGVATAYNAPIAGAVFISEIVLGSVAIESLGPLIVSAVAANIVVSAIWGVSPVYQMPQFKVPSGVSTTVFAALGLAAGLLAPVFLASLDRARSAFGHWKVPVWLKLTTGGLGVGAISIMNPAVWGNGYSVVNSILQGGWAWQALMAILIFKVLAVSMTVGSGAVGGVFTPILFVGAVTGALFGGTVEWLWPALMPESASVAVGMGAFLAACTHAPLMSVLMIFEMTENYSLIVPLMLSCVLAYFVSRVLRPASIYSDHARSGRHAPSLTMAFDFLRLDPPTIRVGGSVAALEKVFLQFRWQHVYVTNADGVFMGAISLHDFSPFMRKLADASAPWPETLLKRDYPRVAHDMAIWQLMEVFTNHPGERLPVLDDSARLLGYLTKTDIVLIFSEQLSN